MTYLYYALSFLPFGALAFFGGYAPLAIGDTSDPPFKTAVIVFVMMLLIFWKRFLRLDRPFRTTKTEEFVATAFFGGCYLGLLSLAGDRLIARGEPEGDVRNGLAVLGNLALLIVAYTFVRVWFFERSHPKSLKTGGGCCGGHHHHH